MNVYVKENEKLTVDTQKGPFVVNLAVSPGNIEGKTSVETVNGVASFKTLKFKHAGITTLTAISEGITSASVTLNIKNYAHIIQIITPDDLIFPYVSFNISACVFDFNYDTVISDEPVLISVSNNLLHVLQASLSDGLHTFLVYFTESGEQSLDAKTVGKNGKTVYASATIYVQKLQLAIFCIDPIVRFI